MNLIRRANSTCAYILRTFSTRNCTFLTRVFVAYVRPILEYASQLWSPNTIDIINRLERVQRLFTKRIRPLSHFSYDDRLNYLGLCRLETRRLYLDLMLLGKLKFNFMHLSLHDLTIKESALHVNRFISLTSHSRNAFYFFTLRTIRLWNSLLPHTAKCVMLHIFVIYYTV